MQFPEWLRPEIIPGLPFRWYGLMYIVAFATAWFLFRFQVRERNFPIKEDDLSGLFFRAILCLILGARIFAALVYETSPIYRQAPWLIFWPFRNGQFTGFTGMSYHGGVIGATLIIFLYSWRKKYSFREIGDMFAASIPLGYTAGRIGNFINGELYGRVTASPLGIIFPGAEVPYNETWVREIAEKTGVPEIYGFINLPRHPSQLYEALFEGIVLWLIIWFFRNRKPFKGFLVGLYFMGYGLFRFIIEYFREPDIDLGYRIALVKTDMPPALYSSPFNFTTGQILCFVMILAGAVWLFLVSRLTDKDPIRRYPTKEEISQAEKKQYRKDRRKFRKKLG